MKKLIVFVTAGNGVHSQLFSYIFLALSIAVVGNIFMTHQASATFFAPRGQTQINYGTDVVTGEVCSASNLCSHLYIDQGNTVGWRANLWNAGDLEGNTKLTVKNRYFDATYSTGTAAKPHAFVQPSIYFPNHLEKEPAIILGAANDYYYGASGFDSSVKSWDTGRAALTSSVREDPGSTYCRVTSVYPAGANYIPYVGSSSLGASFPPLPPFTDWRTSTFWPGTMVGPLGPSVYGSAAACAEIAYNYDITPSIDTVDDTGPTDVVGNPSVAINPVRSTSPVTDTNYTQWIITQVIVPSDPGDSGATNTTAPCNDAGTAGLYKTKYGNCKIVAQSGTNSSNRSSTRWKADGTLKDVNPAGSPTLGPTMNFPRPAGSGIVCYVLSVNSYRPYLSGSSNWRHSRMVCPNSPGTIKHPKVQATGDDARVGGKIDVTAPVQLAKIFGSWGEYASYSAGDTNNFATASGFNNLSITVADTASWSTLTHANVQSPYGNFADRSAIASSGAKNALRYFADNAQSYAMSSLSPADTINFDNPGSLLTNRPNLIDNKTAGRTLKITGGTIQKGKTYIIVATGRVEISGNIAYTTDPLANLKEIPQVVIIAHDIDITDAVSNIDAWLITPTKESVSVTNFTTPGTINTCSSVSSAGELMNSRCAAQLTVNGPVVTDKLLLWRTAGGRDDGTAADPDPAERFNNRGDAYLWALGYASSVLSLDTTSTTELPPRY